MGLMEMETGGLGDATSNSSIVDSAWRGAEAFHFLMLCQRQLYEGYVDAAMKTALHLREYEELLNQEDIYCLLALSSCANRAFGTCAKAFIKLDAIEQLSAEEREEYQELGMDIFVKYSPKDSRFNRAECTNCETMIPDWCGTCPSCSTKFWQLAVTMCSWRRLPHWAPSPHELDEQGGACMAKHAGSRAPRLRELVLQAVAAAAPPAPQGTGA